MKAMMILLRKRSYEAFQTHFRQSQVTKLRLTEDRRSTGLSGSTRKVERCTPSVHRWRE